MNYEASAAQLILRGFNPFLYLTEDETQFIGEQDDLKIPKFSFSLILKLCDETIDYYITEEKQRRAQNRFPHLLEIPLPAYAIGDLHGNFHDLIRIWSKINFLHDTYSQTDLKNPKPQPKRFESIFDQKFIFLGDYVDRGQFSLEIVLLLFALKIQYPQNFYLLRGNHEFASINGKYGFLNELVDAYGGIGADDRPVEPGKGKHDTYDADFDDFKFDFDPKQPSKQKITTFNSQDMSLYGTGNVLWKKINQVFNYFPLAAIAGDQFFCVHGGLSPHLTSLQEIGKIPYPLNSITPGLVCDLVWSDPTNAVSEFVANPRGVGVAFGKQAMLNFFKATNLQRIVRAHEKQERGIRSFKHIVTIFSTSGYSHNNRGGFCKLLNNATSNDNDTDDNFDGEANDLNDFEISPRPITSTISRSMQTISMQDRNRLDPFADHDGLLGEKSYTKVKGYTYEKRNTVHRADAIFYDYITQTEIAGPKHIPIPKHALIGRSTRGSVGDLNNSARVATGKTSSLATFNYMPHSVKSHIRNIYSSSAITTLAKGRRQSWNHNKAFNFPRKPVNQTTEENQVNESPIEMENSPLPSLLQNDLATKHLSDV